MGRHTRQKLINQKNREVQKKIRVKTKVKKTMVIILMLIFLSLMGYSVYKIINYTVDTIEINQEIDELNEFINIDDENVVIDFNQLKEVNPDTVGWLIINNTNINYPVVKTKNNDYYLTHNFKKKPSGAGWLFADYTNKVNDEDKNIVIYGHSMKNKTMFGELSKVLRNEWYTNEDNLNITFVTPEAKYTFRVFSIYKIEAEDYYINTKFNNDKDFSEFVTTIKDRSLYKLNTETENISQVLTLSTCYDNYDMRLVVHAAMINKEVNEL